MGHIKLAVIEEDGGNFPMLKQGDARWFVSIAAVIEGITRLISASPAGDRHAIEQGMASSRKDLPSDVSAPLRDLYRSVDDRRLYDIIDIYFGVVKELFWSKLDLDEKGKTGSFIVRTVGILALFDALRKGLMTGQIDVGNIDGSSRSALNNAAVVDFRNNFFHASGAGRTRIRKTLEFSLGTLETTDKDYIEIAALYQNSQSQT